MAFRKHAPHFFSNFFSNFFSKCAGAVAGAIFLIYTMSAILVRALWTAVAGLFVTGASTSDRIACERSPAPPQDLQSTWLVLLVASAMGFLASLGLAASNGADVLAKSWTQTLENRATIILPAPLDATTYEATIRRALQVVRGAPGIIDAQPLAAEEIEALLAPWLGDDPSLINDIALPTLIDVAIDPGYATPLEALRERLASANILAEVDAHGRWIDKLEPAADQIRFLARTGLAIIALAAALMVAIACTAALSSQRQMVSVLKLVGARDEYIAGLFMRRYQFLAFLGSAVGVGAAAIFVVGLPYEGDTPLRELAPIAPRLSPDPWIWAQFAAAPLAFALIATLASWISVTVALQSSET
jgi:cell division transport system permease protein